MMQAADQRHLDHLPTVQRLHRPWNRTVVIEEAMRADFEVILEIGFENLPQLPFIENDHAIQAFPPDGSDEALDVGTLPRRSWGNQLLLDTHPLDPTHKVRSVNGIPVPQQILGCCVIRERVDDLLRRPCRRRCLGNIEMNNLAPFMPDDHQHIKQAEGRPRDHKEIHRCDGTRVVLEKGPPALGAVAPGLGPVLLYRGCRGVQSEFGQFIPNPWAAPRWIDRPHSTDELNQFPVLSRSPNSTARLPSPKEPEPGPLPADDRLGAEDHQSTSPTGPQSLQSDPDQSIARAELGFVDLAFEDRKLVPQGQDLQGELVLGTEPGQKVAQERGDNRSEEESVRKEK